MLKLNQKSKHQPETMNNTTCAFNFDSFTFEVDLPLAHNKRKNLIQLQV